MNIRILLFTPSAVPSNLDETREAFLESDQEGEGSVLSISKRHRAFSLAGANAATDLCSRGIQTCRSEREFEQMCCYQSDSGLESDIMDLDRYAFPSTVFGRFFLAIRRVAFAGGSANLAFRTSIISIHRSIDHVILGAQQKPE